MEQAGSGTAHSTPVLEEALRNLPRGGGPQEREGAYPSEPTSAKDAFFGRVDY